MHASVLTLLLCLPCVGAFAAPWKHVAAFPAVVAEIDVASIQARGALVVSTFRFNHSSPQTNRSTSAQYLSSEVKALFDCKQRKYVPYHRTEFEGANGQGRIVGTLAISEPEAKLVPIIEGSMNEHMLHSACAGTQK